MNLAAEQAYQDDILQKVSRTFALTIPQLPESLHSVVANAYLLCRITDTIEDTTVLTESEKLAFHAQFCKVVAGVGSADTFADSFASALQEHGFEAEVDLVRHTADVVRLTQSYRPAQQAALRRCVDVMSAGMAEFERRDQHEYGVENQAEMDRYCYYVAGVVGEMLTDLFIDYLPELKPHEQRLRELAVSFGQGLQMTNILKDVWDDKARDECWLPRDLFERHGVLLSDLKTGDFGKPGFRAAMQELLSIAVGHLDDALTYTLMIPAREKGIRRFCLWAIGMAVLTLRNIHAQQNFAAGAQVKISRKRVKQTIFLTNLMTKRDGLLRLLFSWSVNGLPREASTP